MSVLRRWRTAASLIPGRAQQPVNLGKVVCHQGKYPIVTAESQRIPPDHDEAENFRRCGGETIVIA